MNKGGPSHDVESLGIPHAFSGSFSTPTFRRFCDECLTLFHSSVYAASHVIELNITVKFPTHRSLHFVIAVEF